MYYLKILFTLSILFSNFIFSQNTPKDSILETPQKNKGNIYASKIDSAWVQLLHKQLKIKTTDFADMDTISVVMNSKKVNSFPDSISTEQIKTQLKLLNEKTPIKIEYNKSLEKLIRYFLKNKYALFENLMNLSQYYFPIMEEILDKYNLPLELKYMAVIESALNPRAKSRVGARGLWQFMYNTAKMYDLKVTSFTDDRYDPIKSTDAACRYLSDLYNIFGDWALTLASYNAGPGTVSRAIRRSGGQFNFWSIRRYMPRETSGYFPLFITSMYIFEYADQFGLKQSERQYHYYETNTTYVKEKMSFEQIARLTKTTFSEVAFLNPIYKLNAIPARESRPYQLRLPIKQIGYLISNEEAIYDTLRKENKPLPVPPEFKGFASPDGIYIVKKGDSLWSIARLFPGVSAKNLIKWNRNVKNSNIKPGIRIKICSSC